MIVQLLEKIEKVGKRFPSMAVLLIYAFFMIIPLSYFLSSMNFSFSFNMPNGYFEEKIEVKSFIFLPNLLELLCNSLSNFINFPPLVITLVVSMGIGIAQYSGFLYILASKISALIPKRFATPTVLIISILSHIVGNGAYIFLIPLCAIIFLCANRHPIAGIATAFAGFTGGFATNFTPLASDSIMQKLTQNASHVIDLNYQVNLLCNYYISLGGTIGVILGCWWVCEKIIEPFLDKNLPIDIQDFKKEFISPSPIEQKAFKYALWWLGMYIGIIFLIAYPKDSLLRNAQGSLTSEDCIMIQAFIPLLFAFFAIPGYIFGKMTKKFTSFKDVCNSATKPLRSLSEFIFFCFVCSQFLYIFNHSNLSKLLAFLGADFLRTFHLPNEMTILGFILLCSLINFCITSPTSKWALLSPIFVPMFMLLGISPELTQASFKISDHAFDIISPFFAFSSLIMFYCKQYCSKINMSMLCAIMLPYSLMIFFTLILTLYLFWWFKIPLGV